MINELMSINNISCPTLCKKLQKKIHEYLILDFLRYDQRLFNAGKNLKNGVTLKGNVAC